VSKELEDLLQLEIVLAPKLKLFNLKLPFKTQHFN
jgi:hypothetical protein